MEDTYLKGDMHPGEGSYKDKEEGGNEILVKLSATHVIKRDTLAAIVPSIHGTNEAEDKKP